MNERIVEKLSILADAAKYDVSCSSSGSKRKNENKGLGNSEGMGICHAYTEDGRCVSLLKIYSLIIAFLIAPTVLAVRVMMLKGPLLLCRK